MTDVEIELSKAALVDSIRDEIIKMLKDMPSKFTDLDEKRQRYFIGAAADLAKLLARGACDIIAADGRSVLDCTVGKVGINKTTIEAQISVAKDRECEALIKLGSAAHGPAVLSFVNYEKHTTEQKRPEADPDQLSILSDKPVAMSAVMDETATKPRPGKKAARPDPAAIADQWSEEDMAKAEGAEPAKLKTTSKPKSGVKAPRKTPTGTKRAPARKRPQRTTIKAGRNGGEVTVLSQGTVTKDEFALVEDD